MKSKFKFLSLSILFLIIISSSCKNLNFTDSILKGKVLPSLENATRTIYPSIEKEGLTDFTLYKTSISTENQLGTWTDTAALENAEAIEIGTGTYDFILTAKLGTLSFTGTIKNVKVKYNKTSNLNFTVMLDDYGSSEVKGSLNLSVCFPDEDITAFDEDAVSVSLFSFFDNKDFSDDLTVSKIKDGDDSTLTITADLPAGKYHLTVEIAKDGSENMSYSEEVWIASGLVSSKTFTSEGFFKTDINPTINSKASVSQDFIFNTDSVGITKITIRRSEWNKMLQYYDYFYKNENSVIAESYEYSKDGTDWKLNTVGLRLRGNTSRFRPQGKDTPTDETGHTMPNASWSTDYYNYAATCSDDDYRQSHFKVDFEPYDDDDRKMSDCMKSVALKRCDSVFSREIFCYNLFHEYGIWTAPRASQTKVYIDFIEDIGTDGNPIENIDSCQVTNVDFGVYEMFEEVNKQSLKGRMSKKGNNSAENVWVNNDGDLWKCSGGDLTESSNVSANFGVEQVEILNTDQDKSKWDWIWYGPCYDLKTNKDNVDEAAEKFQGFVTELNNLANIDQFTEDGIQARKDFYEKWFDVDFFIKTYAVNMLVGMDDDYWGNANNYYLYFDNGKKGSGKCYLIPFDYDNTLGCSITGDKVYTNPFEWGNGKNRPLLDRLLEVPEYVEKFKAALLEVSSQDEDSPWNKDKCIALWNKWFDQVSPYVATPDIPGWPNQGSTSISDSGGWKAHKHYLAQETDNLYEQVTNNFKYWLSGEDIEIKFDLNGGSLNNSTEIVTGIFNGVNSSFDSMVGNPVRTGYEFVGWTKTKNGTDYTEAYNGEDDLTVYASWVDISGLEDLSIFEIPDSSYEGIKIGIINLPEDNYRRNFYMKAEGDTNFKEIGGDSKDGSKYGKIWAYPFVKSGKTYEFYVSYSNINYKWLANSNTISVKANSGIGEFKVTNKPEYYIENNILKWKTEPVIQVGDENSIREDNNWDEYYLLQVESTMKKDDTKKGYHESWNYQSWNYLGASCNTNFSFKEHVNEDVLNGTRYDLCFQLRYSYNSLPYGDLCLIIYDYGDIDKFNIE